LRYRLVYTHRAARDISGLDANVQKRIGKAPKRYEEIFIGDFEVHKNSGIMATPPIT
jgi:hypothetical protein